MAGFGKPSERDFTDFNTLARRIGGEQALAEGGRRSTYSMTGVPQYAASVYTESDILQGIINFKDPSETLLVTNHALTKSLQNLSTLGAEGLSQFSTAAPSPSLTTPGGSGQGAIGFDQAGNVRRDWVESLPGTHESGAWLWKTHGKIGLEMHLPTSGNLQEDINQHRQLAELPPNRRHPWYMDRTDPNRGGDVPYYDDVNKAATILGENPNNPGINGAFGYLSPEEEQWYMCAQFPYTSSWFHQYGFHDVAEKAKNTKKEWYKGRRILIWSEATQRACVCTPGDWGPGSSVKKGRYFGASPDVMHYLGINTDAEVIVKFMPDSTPLGPYNPQTAEQGAMPAQYNHGLTMIDATGGFINTPDEMAYAGQRIINHPNFRLEHHTPYPGSATRVFTQGFSYVPAGRDHVPAKNSSSPGRAFLMPSLYNWIWTCMEAGFVFGGYLGAYNHRNKNSGPKLSIHAKGGAIDIGYLGFKGGNLINLGNHKECRPIVQQFVDFCATLRPGMLPQELGGPFEYTSASGLRMYRDKNPNHLHFGFEIHQCGQLISALKPGYSPGPSTGIRGVRGAI